MLMAQDSLSLREYILAHPTTRLTSVTEWLPLSQTSRPPAGTIQSRPSRKRCGLFNLKRRGVFLPFPPQLKGPSYPFYFPHFDVNEKFPPTEIFGRETRSLLSLKRLTRSTEFTDPGTRADPAKPNLLSQNTTTHDISPYIGTEVSGVQISQLSPEGLDELALFAAERKVLLFRDQDFKDLSPERQIEIARCASMLRF
jgi:hypothetical protein